MLDIRKNITDKILTAMRSGDLPWIKPWSNLGLGGMPGNAVTRRAYSGVNVALLWMGDHASHRYLTFQQAKEAGGHIRKGEKGTQIVFTSSIEKTDEQGNKSNIPFLKYFTVFALEQCEGLDHLKEKPIAINPDRRDELADQFIASTGADLRHGEGRAYYRHTQDYIMMPAFETFKNSCGYYETVLHELIHWTGAESRCNRQFGKRFGDQAYAAEELVAELGAAFLCAEFGYDAVTQHAAYLQNWIGLIESDPRAFITAASKASAAVEYLRGLAIKEKIAA